MQIPSYPSQIFKLHQVSIDSFLYSTATGLCLTCHLWCNTDTKRRITYVKFTTENRFTTKNKPHQTNRYQATTYSPMRVMIICVGFCFRCPSASWCLHLQTFKFFKTMISVEFFHHIIKLTKRDYTVALWGKKSVLKPCLQTYTHTDADQI